MSPLTGARLERQHSHFCSIVSHGQLWVLNSHSMRQTVWLYCFSPADKDYAG